MRSLILAVFLIPPVYAVEFDGKSIHLSPEEAAKCMMEGGCAVISRKDFEEAAVSIYQEGFMDGEKAASQSCKKTDWRKMALDEGYGIAVKREGWDG